MPNRSRHASKGKAIKIRRGLAIYQTYASPFYQARVWDHRIGKYVVRSTQEKNRIEARRVAEEIADKIFDRNAPAPREYSFRTYARRYVEKARQQAEAGDRNANYIRTIVSLLDNAQYGLVVHFGNADVRQLTTRDWQRYIENVAKKRPDFSPSTWNSLRAAFRNVMTVARDDGVVDAVPVTPKVKQKESPRSFFQFSPLRSPEADEWEILKRTAKQLASEEVKVRGITITEELYDVMLFCLHTFIRPISTELFELQHRDITINTHPNRLTLNIRKGKTGPRISESMPAAIAPYRRLKQRYPDAGGQDYIFMPQYRNRVTAARNLSNQFNHLLSCAELKYDPVAKKDRTLYSLRHTAICMRLVLSGGRASIFSLAKNAGTSVDQIEKVYAKRLPLAGAMLENFQHYEPAKKSK